jgi:hypothetical protein
MLQAERLTKVTAASSREIRALAAAGGFPLPAGDELTPPQFLNQLLASNDLESAVKFMAFALPHREAVWWACGCARMELSGTETEPVLAALQAAETWVRSPTDPNRRAALARAQATDFRSPAAWAAVAAFWSGGSMSPEDQPEVPAPPHLRGVAVAGSVGLAAVQSEPLRAAEKRERYIAAAIDIANGGTGRKPSAGG